MRIAAGIVGILVGISSLSYIGLFGGLLGSATSWLGSGPWSHGDSTVTNLGQMISLLSYLSGLLAIAGGIVAFSNTRVGGIILAASAFSHWYLLGFGVIGKVFILPIGVAAAFAFFAARSGLQSAPAMSSGNASSQTSDHASNATTSFDRAKWNALLQYDKDISAVAEKLKPLGEKWVDELASSYLTLNDKTYLPEIERTIVAAARAEAEDNEQQRIYREEQQKASLQAQERLAEARRKQFELWRDRLWRHKVVVGGILLSLVVGGGYWSYQKQETEKLIAAERQRDAEARAKAETLVAAERHREAEARAKAAMERINAPIPVKPYMSFTTDPASTTTFSIWLWKEGGRYVGAMKLVEGSEGVGPLNELANVQLDEKSGHLSFVSNLQYCIRDTPRHVSFDGTVDIDKKLLTGSLKSPGLYFDNKSTLHQCCDDAPNFRRYSSLNEWRQSWSVVPTECLPR